MSHGLDKLRRLALRTRPQSTTLCSSCLSAHRRTSSAAPFIETAPIEASTASHAPPPPLTASSPHSMSYRIKASVLLSRPPLLTRDLTPFEKAHFLYQKRLNERLALPFTRYFYYQRGTPGEVEWKQKIKERKTPAREIGRYSGYGEDSWNDEVLVGDETGEPAVQIQSLVKDAEVEVKGRDGSETTQEELERPMSRRTQADERGEMGSLNRLLTRTLYLLVKKGGEGAKWMFPTNELLQDESLHTAAERIIVQTGGINMNTWIVGNMPVGHQVYNYSKPVIDEAKGIETRGEKTFFMKARIMAGKPTLKGNQFDLADYQWLAKNEIQKVLELQDWTAVKNILAER